MDKQRGGAPVFGVAYKGSGTSTTEVMSGPGAAHHRHRDRDAHAGAIGQKAIVDQLNAEMVKIIATPETRARLLQLGFESASGTPQQLADFGRAEREKWGPLIRAAGLKAD